MAFSQPTCFSKMMLFLAAFFATIGLVLATPAPLALSADDVILLDGNGEPHFMKEAEFAALERRADQEAAAAALAPRAYPAPQISDIAARDDCEQSTEVQVMQDKMVVYPDVAISTVISGENLTLAYVSVGAGYSLSNSISVEGGAKTTLVEDVLAITLSISYTTTWTTSVSAYVAFSVPHNMYGVIVSQPYAREIKGNVINGCTDTPTITPFTSATYSSESYKDLSWVRGILRLCTNETYPIPYCIGTGVHK